MVEPEPENDNDKNSKPNNISADRTGFRKYIIVEIIGKIILILITTEENYLIMEFLLEFKTNSNVVNIYGWIPLIAAAL